MTEKRFSVVCVRQNVKALLLSPHTTCHKIKSLKDGFIKSTAASQSSNKPFIFISAKRGFEVDFISAKANHGSFCLLLIDFIELIHKPEQTSIASRFPFYIFCGAIHSSFHSSCPAIVWISSKETPRNVSSSWSLGSLFVGANNCENSFLFLLPVFLSMLKRPAEGEKKKKRNAVEKINSD